MSDEVKPKVETYTNKWHNKNTNEEWLAPTSNLEKVTFDFGVGIQPGEFKTRLNHLDDYMSNPLNHGRPQLSKACKLRYKTTIIFVEKSLKKKGRTQ